MTINIRPLADKMFILPAPAEGKAIDGIIIPGIAEGKPSKSKIVTIGHDMGDEEMVLKIGDIVLYDKYAGTGLGVEDTKYLIMRQSDVLATLG